VAPVLLHGDAAAGSGLTVADPGRTFLSGRADIELTIHALGFSVWGSGSRAYGLGCRV